MAHRTITSEKRSSCADASTWKSPEKYDEKFTPSTSFNTFRSVLRYYRNCKSAYYYLENGMSGIGYEKIILKSWHAWNWKPWKETLATRYSERHHACSTKQTALRLLSQTHGPAPAQPNTRPCACLGRGHFCSEDGASALSKGLLLHPYKTAHMHRKGWSTVQVPDGWLQVIRGPRHGDEVAEVVKWAATGGGAESRLAVSNSSAFPWTQTPP